jgi:hypothetical protein
MNTKANTVRLFFQGMGTIGQIFPSVHEPEPVNWASAWQGVGDAFAAAGDNLRTAIGEFRDAKGIDAPQKIRYPFQTVERE